MANGPAKPLHLIATLYNPTLVPPLEVLLAGGGGGGLKRIEGTLA